MPSDTRVSTAPPPHPRRWWVLGVVGLSVLLVMIDNTIVNVALPTLARELEASTSELQWVVDGYTLVFAGLLLVGGNLADRWGRRRTLETGLVVFALASIAASLADSTAQLVAARAVMAVGAAFIYPATLAIISNVFTEPRERATAIGVWAGLSGVAVAVGPVTGGLLLDNFAWGSIFLISVPLAAVAFIAGRREIPESADPDAGRFDLVGAALSIAAISVLVWTIIEAPNNGWTSTTTVLGGALAVGLFAGFVVVEIRRRSPILDVRLFTNARFSAASGAIAMAFGALFGFIFVITQYFQAVRGYDTLTAGLATLPFAVVIGAMSPVAIVVMKRIGTKLVVAGGLALMSAGFLVAAGTAVDAAYWGPIVTAMSLMAAGLAFTTGPATEAIMGALSRAQAGAGSAVNDTAREVGGTLGVAVIGSVLVSAYGPAIADSFARLGLPVALTEAADESVMAGLTVAATIPGPAQEAATFAVRDAFMAGLAAGSYVAALATALAAVAALVFLPARARTDHGDDVTATPPEPART